MMNDSTRVMSRSRRAWPSAALTTAAILATAAPVLLATACGASPSSTGPGGSSNAGGSVNSPLLAFSQCMRSHGVPNFPDPQPRVSNAKFPSAQQLGVSNSRYEAADNACAHLLPAGFDDQFPPAEVQQLLIGMREFSQCMRSHGVLNWPDPSVDSEGRPVFDLSDNGFSRSEAHSPQLGAKEAECQHLLPSALGGLPEGLSQATFEALRTLSRSGCVRLRREPVGLAATSCAAGRHDIHATSPVALMSPGRA